MSVPCPDFLRAEEVFLMDFLHGNIKQLYFKYFAMLVLSDKNQEVVEEYDYVKR